MSENNYYFTFGSSGQIYKGGWVQIKASTLREAQEKFIRHFEKKAYKSEGILSYASHYDQAEYEELEMFRTGNFGSRCHEVIE